MWELSAQGKTLSFEKVGRYWGSKAGEIDIVAIGSEEKNLILGECKYTKKEKYPKFKNIIGKTKQS